VSWYQLLTGETPFNAGSAREVILKHINEEPPSLAEKAPHVGEDVRGLVAKLMAKDPEQRIPSARQLQADLAELARRYTLRDTVLLRLDALAPNQAPSPELAQTVPSLEAERPPLRLPKGIFWALLGVIAVGLLVGAFLVTTSIVREDEQARVDSAQEDLRVVRALVEEGELDQAAELALIAAARMREDGLEAMAAEAERIATEAQEKQVRDREDNAATELRKIRGLAKSYLDGPQAPDPESAARLEEVVQALNDLAGNYPGTEAAAEAAAMAQALSEQLEGIRTQQEESAARLEEARRMLHLAKGRIDDLLDDGRYGEAKQRAEEFLARHSDVELKGADTLVTEVKLRAERDVDQTIIKARQLQTEREDWEGARSLLEQLLGSTGFPRLEQRLRAALEDLEEAKAAARRQAIEDLRRRDASQLEELRRRVGDELARRRFGEAVDAVGLEAGRFEVREVRGEYEAWIDRLRGAERAVTRFLEAVDSGELVIAMDVEFVPGRGKKPGRVVEVDRVKRVLVFEGERKGVLADLPLEAREISAERLLDWQEQLDPQGAARLDVASLAWELGLGVRGKQILIALDPGRLTPRDRERRKALLFLDQQERR
jgi:hypothetical protein